MGREHPMQVSPAGKPSIKARQTAESHGTLPIHTGHGKEYAQVTAKNPSGGGKPGGKKLVDICSGHGTEYGQESSRG